MSSKQNRLVFICLLFTVFLDQVGVSIIFPLIPSLLESITGDSVANNAVIGGWLIATYGIMQFIFAPIMGAVSDRFGRKIVLVLCFIAFSVDYLLYAVAHNLYLLFLARIIAGIAGSSLVVSMAAVADISDEDNKTVNYSYVFATVSLGLICGPLISAVSIDYGLRAPFYIAFLLSLFSLLVVILFFKETLSAESRTLFKVRNPVGSFIHLSRHKGVVYILLLQFLLNVAIQFPITLWAFFTKYRFSWSDAQVANSFMVLAVINFFVQVVLVKTLYPILGNKKIAYIGFASLAMGLLIMSFSYSVYLFYFSLIFYGLAVISNSAMTSIYSSSVLPSEQGQVMGTLTSIGGICAVIGPILASYSYHYSLALDLPLSDGYPFLFSTILVVVCMLLLNKVVTQNKID